MPEMTPSEYVKTMYRSPHFEILSTEAQEKEYEYLRKTCNDATAYWESRDRPLTVLAIHGSGRDLKDSCALAESNSTRLLREGLKALEGSNARIAEIHMRDRKYNRIEGCNNCVSTASSLCGYPCDCFALRGEPAQLIYPEILRADVILMSSGVKQAAMDSRLKMLLDRLISLDGGYEREKFRPKDANFRDEQIARSREGVTYIPRMAGRVSAYFLSSKDHDNPADKAEGVDYLGQVAKSLRIGNDSFGIHHPEPFYVGFYGMWNEDYSYDHDHLLASEEALSHSRKLVLSAFHLATQFRAKGYPKQEPARENRT